MRDASSRPPFMPPDSPGREHDDAESAPAAPRAGADFAGSAGGSLPTSDVLTQSPSSAADSPTADWSSSLPAQTSAPRATPTVTRVGRYTIQAQLGEGSYGVVFRGWDESLQRAVAIKLMRQQADVRRLEKWLAEARTLAGLDHPGIVPVYDVGTTPDGRLYIVSKLVTGGSLSQWLRGKGRDLAAAVRIAAAIGEALGYAHARGIVHRDIKPANILMTDDAQPVLADFGLAMHDAQFGTGARFVGTPAYMSPEQARMEGHRVDGRSDIYSLGVVLYELLTGARPFPVDDVDELLECIRTVDVRPPRQLDRHIGRELERICLKALSKRSADRYSTAYDLVEDLQRCGDAPLASVSVAPAEAASGVASRSGPSASSEHLAIVPRGLRAFDASDADFFLQLLPGPRDREGVPESVRWWRARIEDRAAAFRVGLLLGPSGSGKSSFVRAGVLPRLDPTVCTVFVEARPDGLESLLVRRIHHALPNVAAGSSLRETLIAVRQQIGAGAKLLIVIDQFEQWLQAHAGDASSPLLEALRQCDGVAVQALLLARDDFTLAVSRCMEHLEEPLRQGQNFATIDRFSNEHARRVLLEFGQAYGRVDDDPSRDQKRFVDAVIDELSASGPVIPIQIALFAEMMKDRDWTPTALHEVGGATGVGERFLQESLSASATHPLLRAHAPLVKQLLAHLLPDAEQLIKTRAVPRQELLRFLCRSVDEATAARLLELLDAELRLITPTGDAATDSASTDASRSGSGSEGSGGGGAAYQLAHDFLVPTIRNWLAADERASRAGRARIRLRELAELWHRKPESRRLPTVVEWLAIRFRTRRAIWTDAERRLMTAAARRFTRNFLLVGLVLVAVVMAGQAVFSRWHAQALTDRLLNADTAEVPAILQSLRGLEGQAARRLAAVADGDARTTGDAGNGNVGSDSSTAGSPPTSTLDRNIERRRKLHVALALAVEQEASFRTVVEELPRVPVEHLAIVRDRLAQRPDWLKQHVEPRFMPAFATDPVMALACGAMLTEQNDVDWSAATAKLIPALLAVRPVQLADWRALYQPQAERLLPELLEQFRQRDLSQPQQRGNLLELITSYAAGDAVRVSAAVEFAEPAELPLLLAAVANESLEFRTELRRRLVAISDEAAARRMGRLPQSAAISSEAIPAELTAEVQRYGGYFDLDFGWVTAAPREAFESFARQLTQQHFSPHSVRPYRDGEQWLVAAVFHRDRHEWELEWDLSLDQVRERTGGAAPSAPPTRELIDFCRLGEEIESARWLLLWHTAEGSLPEYRFEFDISAGKHEQYADDWPKQGFAPQRGDFRIGPGHDVLYSAIWRKISDDDTTGSLSWRYAGFARDYAPNDLQVDIRGYDVSLASGDSLGIRTQFAAKLAQAEEARGPRTDTSDAAVSNLDSSRLNAAAYLSAMGDQAAAAALLQSLLPKWQNSPRPHEHLAMTYARQGDPERLKSSLATLTTMQQGSTRQQPKPGILDLLGFRAALLAADEATARALLDKLAAAADDSEDQLKYYLRALAVVAGAPQLGEWSQACLERLVAVLAVASTRERIEYADLLYFDVDFHGVRQQPPFQQWLAAQGFGRRYHLAVQGTIQTQESRSLVRLPPAQHEREALELRRNGFHPAVLDAVAGSGQPPECSSVWHRDVIPTADRVTTSRRRANLILSLAHAGEHDALVAALNDAEDRDVRSRLVLHASNLLAPKSWIELLLNRGDLTMAVRRDLLLLVGGYRREQIPPNWLANLELRLVEWTGSEAAEFRAAALWCARQWGVSAPPANQPPPTSQPTAANSRPVNWFHNPAGQTMVVIRPAGRFLMGSPPWEEGRGGSETLHWAAIRRTYALSDSEVTRVAYQQFRADPAVKPYYRGELDARHERYAPELSCPQVAVSWLDAARFCQWLSQREGLPDSEWCYPDIWKTNGENLPPPPNYLQRTGYRLPTEMEWEYAARAGGSDAFHFGNDEAAFSGFEWGLGSGSRTHAAGLLRPNPFGLFDMLGNVVEWCDGNDGGYFLPSTATERNDRGRSNDRGQSGSPERETAEKRLARGGHFSASPRYCRAAARFTPSAVTQTIGFRVARTIRE